MYYVQIWHIVTRPEQTHLMLSLGPILEPISSLDCRRDVLGRPRPVNVEDV
jgi:hypothetical protein